MGYEDQCEPKKNNHLENQIAQVVVDMYETDRGIIDMNHDVTNLVTTLVISL